MDPIAQGPERQARDAMLLKMALEGKDFRQARREVEEARAEEMARPPGTPAPAPLPVSTVTALAVDLVQIEHIEATLQTDRVQVSVEATRITAVQLRAGVARSPQGGPVPAPGSREDPLLVDLDGDGPETTGAEGARPFDLKGDGTAASTSFVTGGDAFLALDRDGDGRITSGLELFGDQHGARDGFAELATFDTNGDRRIDATDPIYSRLMLVDGQGARPLTDSGITALDLAADRQVQELENGDAVLGRGSASAAGRLVPVYAMALQTFSTQSWTG